MKHKTQHWIGAALCAAFAGPPALASRLAPASLQESATEEAAELSPADAVEEIIDSYDAAIAAYREAYAAAKTEEAREEVRGLYPDTSKFAPQLLAIASAHPAEACALDAIQWVLARDAAGDQRAECLRIVVAHHADAAGTGDLCMGLTREVDQESADFLHAVIEHSQDESVRGKATYALAGVVGSQLRMNERLAAADEETLAQYRGYYGEQAVDTVLKVKADELRPRQKALLKEVVGNYGSIAGRRVTLGESATADLFELENLQIGNSAPDITGPDLDGVEFKLSDYRGKVVFLDFWGNW